MSAEKRNTYNQPAPKSVDRFRTFEDLEVYQVARAFRKAMYGVAHQLPDIEKYGLASQIRRAAVSLTNNIAEGHGRYHYLEQIKFTLNTRGSLEELVDDLNVCSDEQYLEADEVLKLKEEAWRLLRLINGYIRYLRERKQGESLGSKETSPAYGLTEQDLDELIGDDVTI
jgi:four helix bundle protein